MRNSLIALAAAASLAAAAGPAHAGLTFDVSFTGYFGDGTGSIDLATDPGNGTFLYTDLNPTFTFTVGSFHGTATFDQTGLLNDPTILQVSIFDIGGGQRALGFSDSVELLDASGDFYLYLDPTGFFAVTFGLNLANYGNSSAVTPASVPEPSLMAMAGLGLAGAGAVTRRFRRKAAA